jgi:DNA-binding NarL/FixJ family response regulator
MSTKMIGLCTDCPHKQYCNSLCPEAELYVKQDVVEQKEKTIGLPQYGKWPEPIEKSVFTRQERAVLNLLAQGRTREEIAKKLEITRKHLKEVIRHLRKKGNVANEKGTG